MELVPKSTVALGGATGGDFCDEDAGVIGNVRHVGATRNAEAQTHAATLQKYTQNQTFNSSKTTSSLRVFKLTFSRAISSKT